MSLKRDPVTVIFIAVETALTAGFLFFTEGLWTRAFQFSAIVLAAIHSFYRFRLAPDRIAASTGFVLTVAADFFLIMVGPLRLLALSLFCIAQTSHAVRLSTFDRAHRKRETIVRGTILTFMVALALVATGGRFDALAILTAVYAMLLLSNAVIAWPLRRRDPFAFPGFLLFILCDVFILLEVGTSQGYFVPAVGSLWAVLLSIPFNLAWLFYVPSQVLLSLSAVTAKKEGSR